MAGRPRSSLLSRGLKILLLLVLSGSILTQQTPCLSKNPLISMLKNNMVQVYDYLTSSANSAICKFEWHFHQTCCEPNSVVAFAENDVKQLDEAINQLNIRVAGVVRISHMHEDQIYNGLKKSKGKSTAEAFKRDLLVFQQGIGEYEGFNKRAFMKRKQCFDYIKYIRTRSLCSTCSGRSSHFFLQGRALISMPVCRTAVNSCAEVWKHSVQLLKRVLAGKAVLQHFKEVIKSTDQLDFADEHTERLENWINSAELQTPIQNCSAGLTTCTEENAKLLCESFLSLRKNPKAARYGSFAARLSQQSQVTAGTASYSPSTSWKVGHGRLLTLSGFQELSEVVTLSNPPPDSLPMNISPVQPNGPDTDLKKLLQ